MLVLHSDGKGRASLSFEARKDTYFGDGGQLEKVNGFQLHVEGFWFCEFRGQSTSLVPEF